MNDLTPLEWLLGIAAWFVGLWLFGKSWQAMKDDYSDQSDEDEER